jgi:uncharacterized membrane protein YecN with MAPEG domain
MPPLATSLVACLALLTCFVMTALVGRARGKYGVDAPATTGHPMFERWFRVHQNTVEQIVVFLPSLMLFGIFVSSRVGAAVGLVWIAGRVLYAWSYTKDPAKRHPGMGLTLGSTAVLLIGAIVGIVMTGARWM